MAPPREQGGPVLTVLDSSAFPIGAQVTLPGGRRWRRRDLACVVDREPGRLFLGPVFKESRRAFVWRLIRDGGRRVRRAVRR
jgi:hypothetical protein